MVETQKEISNSTSEPNVFFTLTNDIPRSKFEMIVQKYQEKEEEFAEYLENIKDDYYVQDPSDLSIDQSLLQLTYNKTTQQRSLITKQVIPKGTLIIENQPLISTLSPNNIAEYCSNCYKHPKGGKLLICSSCKFVNYCNQNCQKAHWSDHKLECTSMKQNLRSFPQSLRLLLLALWKGNDKNSKIYNENKAEFEKIKGMISNASRAIMTDQTKIEEIMNYSMIAFLRNYDLGYNINMENFKQIVHIFFASQCNGFGIADNQMLRIGTGIYYPQNFINHSCDPNCVAVYNGKTQYLISCREIQKGEELTICYIDNGIEEQEVRQLYLREQYYFNCICERCMKQIKNESGGNKQKSKGQAHLDSDLEQINSEALDLEYSGKYEESLEIVDKILKQMKEDKYSKMLFKDLLERASYLCVRLKRFKEATEYHSKLINIYQQLYLNKDQNTTPHPIIGLQYYQMGKLLSQNERFKEAVDMFQKALSILEVYYGAKCMRDGKIVNEELMHELNENYLANSQMLK